MFETIVLFAILADALIHVKMWTDRKHDHRFNWFELVLLCVILGDLVLHLYVVLL